MGIFKNFVMRKLMEKQMKGVPKEQQEKIIQAMEANPELFQKIAAEIKNKTKQGKSQMQASMEVMRAHQSELQKAMRE
ncbi:MAG: hypothetical protein G01um101448_155 [Parcubacteria group bacterium Gr01-1014_48]|nr:MAG: hypothetical protein Greene041614_110 [Parcubacteria group bacterium Greene0416_14]TSC74428.1 MAG: hypothetical protein G01um101448_155 [Parcubacteria group bacterium Gr01-1014_48]TSD01281.1 MAG: hypothetical protein Greene101415_370 [Parcubacteria group bacterium Greene1014_15]TSD08398.1 MAG: hypothetical protein Greene07144_114 [Parcubacteria group bacterium Greene0714_4]